MVTASTLRFAEMMYTSVLERNFGGSLTQVFFGRCSKASIVESSGLNLRIRAINYEESYLHNLIERQSDKADFSQFILSPKYTPTVLRSAAAFFDNIQKRP